VDEGEFKRAVRSGQLWEISFGIIAGVVGLVLSPWLAVLLTHVEGWGGPQVNLYWLFLILGAQTLYWVWRLWRHFFNRSER
jgi:MFS family permease